MNFSKQPQTNQGFAGFNCKVFFIISGTFLAEVRENTMRK